MKTKDKKIWLAALRSGKYKQCKGALHKSNTGGFCCLGVAIDVLVEGDWKLDVYNEGLSSYYFNGNNAMPSNEVLKKIGLCSRDALDLASMNDGGWSFKKIADWIEVNV